MAPPAPASSQPRAPDPAQGRDAVQGPSEQVRWCLETQLLRQPPLALWIDVCQQVAPQVVAACCLQGWDHPGSSSSSDWAVV
eukprot:5533370-Pyramimonas_sp.AAC.1